MSGDEKCTPPAGGAESQTVQVTKADIDAGIATIQAAMPKVTAAGEQGAALWDQLIKALSVPIGGEPPVEVPQGGADVFRSQAAGLNQALSGLDDTLRGWSDTEMTVQEDGKTGVEKAGSGGGTFAGATASGTVDIGATSSGTVSVGETDYSKIR